MDRLNIFHKFLLILSLTTVLAVVALASTISYLLKKSMLENEAGNTASLVKTLIRADLSPENFAQAAREKDGFAFAQYADRLTSMPEVIRIKVYDAAGTLVWSDEKKLVGKTFRDNRELGEALRGQVQVAIGLLKSSAQLRLDLRLRAGLTIHLNGGRFPHGNLAQRFQNYLLAVKSQPTAEVVRNVELARTDAGMTLGEFYPEERWWRIG